MAVISGNASGRSTSERSRPTSMPSSRRSNRETSWSSTTRSRRVSSLLSSHEARTSSGGATLATTGRTSGPSAPGPSCDRTSRRRRRTSSRASRLPRAGSIARGYERSRLRSTPSPRRTECSKGTRCWRFSAPPGSSRATVRNRTFACDTERTSWAMGRRPIESFRSSFKSPGWDRMKDMPGVLEGFAHHVHSANAHLVLAGPAVQGVSDDPEGEAVWEETVAAWRSLSRSDRARVHLACVPMDDPVENAMVINALQTHAAVVVQKSLAEGFGLTVAEAMWKTRPVVASAVGGIVDQVIHDETGLLVEDPHDLESLRRGGRSAASRSRGRGADWAERPPSHRASVSPRPSPAPVRRAAHRPPRRDVVRNVITSVLSRRQPLRAPTRISSSVER